MPDYHYGASLYGSQTYGPVIVPPVTDWPVYTVEISFLGGTAGTFQLDVSSLDVGVLSQPYASISFQSIPGVRSIHIKRGRQDELSTIQAGTCDVIFDNASGNLSPGNPTSIYSPNVLPSRRLRVSATWQGKTDYLFYGFIDSYTPAVNSPVDSDMAVHAVDIFGEFNVQPLNATMLAGDDGTWVSMVLANLVTASMPAAIDPGSVQFILYTAQPGEFGLQVLLDAATSAGGLFFVAADGTNTWHSRYHRTLATRSNTVQGHFGQPDGNGRYPSGIYPFLDTYTYVMDRLKLYTRVVVHASGTAELPQQADNLAAQDLYFLRLLGPVDARFLDTGQALDFAQALLTAYQTPVPRFTSMVVDGDADTDGTLWTLLLGLEIADRVHVTLNRPGQIGLDSDMFVEAVDHAIILDPQFGVQGHQVTYQLSDAATVGNPFILDTSTLDSGRLG